jgi:TetR/AcrR family fatty acid metabolism transcriptional regulator
VSTRRSAIASPRRQRAITRTREDILLAAARTFARSGFRAARMQDIAEEADFSVPSLYAYFRTKRDIWEAVVDRVQQESGATFDEPMPPGLTLRQRLHLLLARQLALADRWSDALAVFFSAEPPARPRAARAASGFSRYADRLAGWLATAGAGELPRERVDDLAHALAGIVVAYVRRAAESGGARRLPRAEDVVGLFLDGASGGEGGRPA